MYLCRLLAFVVGLGVVAFTAHPADARASKRNVNDAKAASAGARTTLAASRSRSSAFFPRSDGRELGRQYSKGTQSIPARPGIEGETGRPDNAVWEQLSSAATEPALVEYTVTEKDVSGPFEPKIPETLEEKAKLERLAYTGPEELLAEKFHMDIGLLKRLNRGKQFDQAGVNLQVANIGRPKAAKAARLEVDKKIGGVFVFDREGAITAFYPATIGSEETPSPSGKVTVTRVARNPTYTYDPAKLNFKGVTATEKFEIKPGPNNPVGLVWIALSERGLASMARRNPRPSVVSVLTVAFALPTGTRLILLTWSVKASLLILEMTAVRKRVTNRLPAKVLGNAKRRF